MAESEEELKKLLMKMKKETEKQLISKIYKQLLQLNSRKINDLNKKVLLYSTGKCIQ